MRILITAGGTKVPIDPVRHIANSSTGRLGTQLAKAALHEGAEVTYLVASDALSPLHISFDYQSEQSLESKLDELTRWQHFNDIYATHYQEYTFTDFLDYQHQLETLIKRDKPDIVVLAAAVSDYLVNEVSDQKIRSSDALTLHLSTAPKIIHSIKEWLPNTFLVGFKLLVNVCEDELIAAGKKSLAQHDADLVIANDLSTVKTGHHEIIMIEKNGTFQTYTDNIANAIIARCLKG